MEPRFIVSHNTPQYVDFIWSEKRNTEEEELVSGPGDKELSSVMGALIEAFKIDLIVDLGAACGHTTYKIRQQFDRESRITAVGVDLHDWTDDGIQDVKAWCQQVCPTLVYQDYLQADLIDDWDKVQSVIKDRYDFHEFNRTVVLSANLVEHVEAPQAVTLMKNLRTNSVGRWIVLAGPVTIESVDHDVAARCHESATGLFTGLDHKCAPAVQFFLKFNPVGGSIIVTPGGYIVAFYDAMTMTDYDSLIPSTTVFKGRFSRGHIYKVLRESLGHPYTCAGLTRKWEVYIRRAAHNR